MTDFPYIRDLNEHNLNEILQLSQTSPLVITFYAPSHADSAAFVKTLEDYANQYQGQFVLAKVDCEKEQMVAAQFRIQALPTTYLFKEGQALDAFQGALEQATLQQRLSVIFPRLF